MDTFFFSLYGLGVQVSTPHHSLAGMIQRYYEPFLVDSLSESDVSIHLERTSYFSKKKTRETGDIILGDFISINTTKDRYFFSDQEISGDISFSQNKIVLSGKLSPHPLRHILHVLLQGFSRIDIFYNRFLIKTCIHDIVFLELQKRLNAVLLHATAVTDGKDAYVFMGLGGSGKSTLASACKIYKGYTILADNYSLVSGNTLYPFPELPRITKGTQKLLSTSLGEKADGIKNYLPNNLSDLKKTYPIAKIYLCSYTTNLDFQMEKIQDEAYVLDALYYLHSYTKEFPEHGNLALLPLIGKYGGQKKYTQQLEKVTQENDFFFLRNTPDIFLHLESILHV